MKKITSTVFIITVILALAVVAAPESWTGRFFGPGNSKASVSACQFIDADNHQNLLTTPLDQVCGKALSAAYAPAGYQQETQTWFYTDQAACKSATGPTGGAIAGNAVMTTFHNVLQEKFGLTGYYLPQPINHILTLGEAGFDSGCSKRPDSNAYVQRSFVSYNGVLCCKK